MCDRKDELNRSRTVVEGGKTLLRPLLLFLATGAGFGLSPVAPGTVGTIWGVAISLLIKGSSSPALELTATVLLVGLAVPLCSRAEEYLGKKDDRRIVADEYLTFPLCMLGIRPTLFHFMLAFGINRALDILKPPPARQAQELPRGWGVVADDLVTSLYTLLLMHFLIRVGMPLLLGTP